jgi:hypothetical protein
MNGDRDDERNDDRDKEPRIELSESGHLITPTGSSL